MGLLAEEAFRQTALWRGWSVRGATRVQNLQEHWDFLISRHDEVYRVEVKGRKRQQRRGQVQDEWLWLELQGNAANRRGAYPGARGWLYGGRADLVAFEQEGQFLLVERELLMDLAEKWIRYIFVEEAAQARYRIYSRRGKDDILAMVEARALRGLEWDIWGKPPDGFLRSLS